MDTNSDNPVDVTADSDQLTTTAQCDTFLLVYSEFEERVLNRICSEFRNQSPMFRGAFKLEFLSTSSISFLSFHVPPRLKVLRR